MRIVSGKHKGKRIIAPKKLPVRPTTDMAKEALFNILNNQYYFEDLSILDLFSGTGNISYEFASRGAHNITSVDGNIGCVRFIAKTAKELEYQISVIKSDVFQFLKKHLEQYDVIFADPPYDFNLEKFTSIADLIFEQQLLTDDGVLIIEHSEQTDLSGHQRFTESRKYGGNLFSFFEN
ncbi:RsmD family RNA methyltransferase [uncultured Croceitalea sp.]|uniref:RsmD family RNA methyltransferase n=1 Tax=uncultured Croceitalea sp. TaxID=1798908 RepID=UPI003305768F